MMRGVKRYIRTPKSCSCLSCHKMALLGEITRPAVTLEKGAILARQGAALCSLFAVHTGSLKQVNVTDNGETLVTALCLPGDMVGLDAIDKGVFPGSLIALETSGVCEIPYEKLDALCDRSREARWLIQRCQSHDIHDERLKLHLLLHRTAEARLACFFLAISERFRLRGYSSHHFRLAMTRSDIASYLGLTPETVGRTLVNYQRQNVMLARGREFRILDLEQLKRLAEANGRRHRQRVSQ